MSESMDLAGMAPKVADIARKAGEVIMVHYVNKARLADKTDKSPLTLADLAAHELITDALQELTPELPVLSEESHDEFSFEIRKDWTRFWLVDPLDGTKEYLKGNDEFTVNIALIDNHKPVLGVVTAPALDREYQAWQGGGAWRSVKRGPWTRIEAAAHLSGPILVAASRSHKSPELEGFLKLLGERQVKDAGSSLKFMLVAEGEAHIYPRMGTTMEWDTAAAQVVVVEAGGVVLDLAGRPLSYNLEEMRNPYFIAAGKPPHSWMGLIKS